MQLQQLQLALLSCIIAGIGAGHTTITTAGLFYNQTLSIGAPAPHINS
jgi:hypothetical protein